jgi:hypothetical protein
VTDETLNNIRDWFVSYARQFLESADAHGNQRAMMELKLAHSRRVAAEARGLARDLGWLSADQNTAEALGWLHDTGRFSQMAEFGTFRDGQSLDHARRGHEVILQANLLHQCSPRRIRQILDSVLHHNALRVPEDVHSDSLGFVRLIRDADKLDIFRIFLDAVLHNRLDDFPEIAHSVDLHGPPSPELLAELAAARVPGYRLIRSLHDWKLVQVSWAYDLFYVPARRRMLDRGVLATLAEMLPRTPEIIAIIATATNHLELASI